MFLPPGYPDSVSPEYRAYRLCAVARTLLGRPTALVSSLFTWSWVYGVGDASRTPEQAVRIDIFLQAVAAVTALAAGFPLFTRAFDYTQPRWKLLSALLAAAAGVLRFGASFVAHRPILFFSTAAAAQAVAAFAGTAGAKVNGLIAPAFIKNRAAVQLVDIKVADTNQAAAVDVVATLLCLAVLRRLAAAPPETSTLLAAYAALQALDVAAAVGLYRYMPPLGARARGRVGESRRARRRARARGRGGEPWTAAADAAALAVVGGVISRFYLLEKCLQKHCPLT